MQRNKKESHNCNQATKIGNKYPGATNKNDTKI